MRAGYLYCDGATVVASTVYLDVDGQDRQTLSQSITLTWPGQRAAVAFSIEGQPFRQPFLKEPPVLDASVTSWACLTAANGKAYIYLNYTCVESWLRPGCEGDRREWGRLFDAHGRPLNAGFPHDGPRASKVMKKLGLGRYLIDGVQLKDIDD